MNAGGAPFPGAVAAHLERHRLGGLAVLRAGVAALVTGGPIAGFVAVHAVHAAAAAGGSAVVGFVCNIVR